ncbi:hypothetical protein POF51_26545 [Brevibacillus sp. AG]|uniref:hypothetical protein n=1 Tax=Brevibacillus sp. AG TaxID=3020891 RepID=UPI00233133BB|nr:hypothetical protein [Brevibacillus sp. AG]MDC0764284.1 hypothetical protein [Brevibacillus sp. AG]
MTKYYYFRDDNIFSIDRTKDFIGELTGEYDMLTFIWSDENRWKKFVFENMAISDNLQLIITEGGQTSSVKEFVKLFTELGVNGFDEIKLEIIKKSRKSIIIEGPREFTYRNYRTGEIIRSTEQLDGRKGFIPYPYMGDVVEFENDPLGMPGYAGKLALMTKNYEKGEMVFLFEDGTVFETKMTCSPEDEFTYLTKEQWLQVVKQYREIHGEDNSIQKIEAYIKVKLNHLFSYEQYAELY